jgi:hypothetical protein
LHLKNKLTRGRKSVVKKKSQALASKPLDPSHRIVVSHWRDGYTVGSEQKPIFKEVDRGKTRTKGKGGR